MKRDWTLLDGCYEELMNTIYPQPEDSGHNQDATRALAWARSHQGVDMTTVIDFGCGEGFCEPICKTMGTEFYVGIAWGKDVTEARAKGRNVIEHDFNFIPPMRTFFTFGISRHSLEHSPFPILTMLHWKKFINGGHLLVVLPHPDWYHYKGQNHFSVMPELQAENVFEQAKMDIVGKYVPFKQGNPDRFAPDERTAYEIWYLLKSK